MSWNKQYQTKDIWFEVIAAIRVSQFPICHHLKSVHWFELDTVTTCRPDPLRLILRSSRWRTFRLCSWFPPSQNCLCYFQIFPSTQQCDRVQTAPRHRMECDPICILKKHNHKIFWEIWLGITNWGILILKIIVVGCHVLIISWKVLEFSEKDWKCS